MIEKDKYIHNNMKKQNQFSPTKPSGLIHETRFPPINNLPPNYTQGYEQRPRRNQSKTIKQIRNRKSQPPVFHTGNMCDGAPMYDQPYIKYYY